MILAAPAVRASDALPRVVASTALIGDVVQQIGGDDIALTVLAPPGTDPHHFEPSARELAQLSKASLIFVNGLGLESFVERHDRIFAEPDNGGPQIVRVSDGVATRAPSTETHADHDHGDVDPHAWTDPRNVAAWATAVEAALSHLLPGKAATFHDRGEAYRRDLDELDAWIASEVASVPPDQRVLVTDHDMLGYFADRYGFTIAGHILPGLSTAAEPSARELAELVRIIRDRNVRVIVVSKTVSPAAAERMARDTGARVVSIYSGSLGDKGSGAESYVASMRYNTSAILSALHGDVP